MYVGGRHACLVSCSLFEQESVRGLVDHYNPVTPSKHSRHTYDLDYLLNKAFDKGEERIIVELDLTYLVLWAVVIYGLV